MTFNPGRIPPYLLKKYFWHDNDKTDRSDVIQTTRKYFIKNIKTKIKTKTFLQVTLCNVKRADEICRRKKQIVFPLKVY